MPFEPSADRPPLLELLGTGTSQGIPVVGCTCAVCRSDDEHDKRLRCAALLRRGETTVLIDCGPDIRMQLLRAGVSDVDAVLITHDHNDHIIGLDDLRPIIFRRTHPVRIFAERRVADSIRKRFAYAFEKHPYPGAPRFELCDLEAGQWLHIGELPPIEALRIMHGSLPILGFRCGPVAYLTDVKEVPAETRKSLLGLQRLVTGALQHHSHHSHMTVEEALALIAELSPEQAYLTHLSHLAGTHRELLNGMPPDVLPAHDGLQLA